MNRQETVIVFEWLRASYPRNYKSLTEKEAETKLENLAYTFRACTFPDVINTYRRAYAEQKTEPHPSEVLAAIHSSQVGQRQERQQADPYEELRRHPEWDQLCRAYGASYVRYVAKISQSMKELKYLLAHNLDT